MKKCPYCAEEIQDDAIKCKYCGEWLEKPSPLNDVLSSVNTFFKKNKEDRIKKKTSHLYMPTQDVPLTINKITLYPDRFDYDGKCVFFSEIKHIYFHSSSISINAIRVNDSIEFSVSRIYGIADTDNEVVVRSNIEKGILSGNLSKKTKQQIFLMYNFIKEKTFNFRLSAYLNELETNGYFTCIGNCGFLLSFIRIHNNGDITIDDKDKILSNIKFAYDNDLIEWGTSWRGLKSGSFNPYEFVIHKSHRIKFRIAGIEINKKININTSYDQDVFEFLIISFLEKGSFLSS